jgi:hypothetical protein
MAAIIRGSPNQAAILQNNWQNNKFFIGGVVGCKNGIKTFYRMSIWLINV